LVSHSGAIHPHKQVDQRVYDSTLQNLWQSGDKMSDTYSTVLCNCISMKPREIISWSVRSLAESANEPVVCRCTLHSPADIFLHELFHGRVNNITFGSEQWSNRNGWGWQCSGYW